MFAGIRNGNSRVPVIVSALLAALSLVACGGPPPAESADDSMEVAEAGDAQDTESTESADGTAGDSSAAEEGTETNASGDDFKRLEKSTAKETHGVKKSELKPSETMAHLKFVVVDKGKGKPIEGIIISLTGPDGKKHYTEATDATGFADVLVPKGQKYDVVFVSLRGKDVAANLNVEDKKNFTLKLTLRYKGWVPLPSDTKGLILDGIEFDTGKATIRPSSHERLDSVVEYLMAKKTARIEISGHTDNVGNKDANKKLSTQRAEACRKYLISKGIDGDRIKAVGYGDERPIASNKTPDGRQKNRRIEAEEL